MPIIKTNQDTIEARIQSSWMEVSAGLKDAVEVYLRRQFDMALIDSTALAVIQVTTELGHLDLAAEMQSDFDTEISNNQN